MSNYSFIKREGIKKCPCCSFSAEIYAYQHPEGYSHPDSWFRVQCSKCGMRTVKTNRKAQALRTWNRRKSETGNTKSSNGVQKEANA